MRYSFVPHEVRLLPRHETIYGEINPALVVYPEQAVEDANKATEKSPSVVSPSDVVDLYNFNGTYFIASRGAKAFSDLLAITMAKEEGKKVKARTFVINSSDPELYLRLNYGDIVDEETFELEAINLTEGLVPVEWDEVFVEALEADSDIYAYIYDYATGMGGEMKKIPLLIGHTGVGKSAIVEKLENEVGPDGYGFRVHTIKGFLDKVDFLGYVQVKEEPGLGRIAQDSPMYELMISTDVTVNTAREMLKHINEDTLTYDDGKLRQRVTRKEVERLKYLARTPVLFFDEINRADPYVISTLMVLFSERRLNNYTFQNAVFITAANWPIDISNQDLETLYQVELIQDPAQLDRFIVIKVSHNDDSVVDAVINYLSDKYSTLPNVDRFLRSLHSQGLLYNPELALDTNTKYVNTSFTTEGLAKFPTFRGWDDVLRYLSVKYATKEPVYVDFIAGLVGNTAAEAAIEYVKELGLEVASAEERGEDAYDVFLDESFKSGIPVLMIGRFGLAKSAKAKQLADKNDAIFYRIDLQVMDRVNLRGYPDKQDLGSVAIGGTLGTLFKAQLDSQGTPLYTTKFVPFDFLRVVQEARETGKHLVIVYDELNRAEPIEQSAIFDAISRGRILGVDVSDLMRKGKLHIIAAGNVGDEYASASFDAAAVARFAVVRKDRVSDRDYESFLRWAKSHFHPHVYDWFKQKKDYFVELLNKEPDTGGGLEAEVFSFRTLEAINAAVASLANTYILSSFMDEIPDEVALAAASSPKWRGNRGPSVRLRYRIVEGPDKGKVKRYSSFVEVVDDIEVLPKGEVVSDILALDAKRLEQAMGFISSAVPSDVWLQINDQVQDLIGAISKDAYESDTTVAEIIGEEVKKSVSGSLMGLYDRIAKDIQAGKGIDPNTLYQAALEKFIESGGSEETFSYKIQTAMIKEVLQEIDELGLADVSGVLEALDVVTSAELGNEDIEIVITPTNKRKEIARLSALASTLLPGSIAIVEDYQGWADATVIVDGKTVKAEVEPKKTGIIRLVIDGKSFGISIAASMVSETDMDYDKDLIAFDGKTLSFKTVFSGEDSSATLRVALRGFEFDKGSVSKLPEVGKDAVERLTKEDANLIPAFSYVGDTIEPSEDVSDSDALGGSLSFLGVLVRLMGVTLEIMMPEVN